MSAIIESKALLFSSSIDIPAATRERVVDLLNSRLAPLADSKRTALKMLKNRETVFGLPLICSLPQPKRARVSRAFIAKRQPPLVCRSLFRTRPAASRPRRVHRFVRALRTIHKHEYGSVVRPRASSAPPCSGYLAWE